MSFLHQIDESAGTFELADSRLGLLVDFAGADPFSIVCREPALPQAGDRDVLSAGWTFFREFLKSPRVVASVVPSSSFVERRVVEAANVSAAQVVVELGPGTGGVTRALLRRMAPQSRLVAIERSEKFLQHLRDIDDDRLEVVHGCASGLEDVLRERGIASADAFVSGIPFVCLPEAAAQQVAAGIHACLAPGGRFVAYQVADKVVDVVAPLMGEPKVELEVRNVPPLRIYTWTRSDQAHPA